MEIDWIRRGLRFECQPECGKCCTGDARDGSVLLEAFDVERLARHLDTPAHAFVAQFTREANGERELLKRNGRCCFLEGAECTVYDARPVQCRSYPFLPSEGFTPIESPYTWRREKSFCPGIGKGRLYRRREILAIVRGQRDASGLE